LGEKKFRPQLGQDNFFEKVLFGHVLSFNIPDLLTPIESSSGLLNT